MDNFMYQFGWAMVPRYLVKYYSGYFCEGVCLFSFCFGMIITLKVEDFDKAYCPLWCDWASFNQLKALREQRLTSPEQEGILPANWFWIWTATPPWVSGLLAYSIRLWVCQASVIMWANSLKQTSLSINTHLVGFVSLENCDYYRYLHQRNKNNFYKKTTQKCFSELY